MTWVYGHQGVQGAGRGYLAHPDDAYLVAHDRVMVADIINCRVVWLNRRKHVVRSLGRAGNCTHDPPTGLLQPNGDTPLPDGGVLVTEIGGWVDRFDRRGRLRWSIKTPTDYPSDAQLLPDGNVLVAGFNTPGRVDVLTPKGKVIWTYERSSGRGRARPPVARRGLPRRQDRRHRRLAPPGGGHRPPHQAHRLAVRAQRHRRTPARVPEQARRAAARAVSARPTPRWGGPAGNELLTSAAAVVLTVLLVAEGITIVRMGGLVTVHMFVGMVLIPPVLLKLASTGYRFARYYARSRPYRAKGPPPLPLRLLAPVLVVTTVVVLGSGVWLMVLGHRSDAVLELHKVSFIVWGVVFGVHFLAHLPTMLRALRPSDVPGASVRALLVAASLGAGVALALSVLSLIAGFG